MSRSLQSPSWPVALATRWVFNARKNRPRANLLTPGFVGNARKRIQFREKKFASILHRISVEIISHRQESIYTMIT